jgi:hypothetical protein
MDLCRSLRWKALYGVTSLSRDELLAHVQANDVPYGCLRSCEPWGPDGHPAAPEACQPGRACFAPSPRLRREEA